MTATALARKTDPVTSKIAAKTVKTQPYKNLLLLEFAQKSQTSEEAAEKAGLLHTGYWKRVSDLFNARLIRPRLKSNGDLMTRTGLSGKEQTVWIITEEGRNAVREIKNSMKA